MSIDDVAIIRLTALPPDGLAELLRESHAQGFQHVRRLVEQWHGNLNRFDRPAESLFAAVAGTRPVGICGLSIDPYTTDVTAGRVRHLYVLAAFRRRGIGRRLVRAVIAAAREGGRFRRLRLRAPASARHFYETIGFATCSSDPHCTHVLDLARREVVHPGTRDQEPN